MGLLAAMTCVCAQGGVFVEAERFADRGGWSVDSQFVDQMGSPYLLAHGLGHPVGDATTEVRIPKAGRYAVWARTCNWTAHWSDHAAGRFLVRVNELTLPGPLGTGDAGWRWMKAGEVELPAGAARLALHDLTGFDGRCDALWLTADGEMPDEDLRTRLEASSGRGVGTERADLVVCGGGVAGICAAVSAARLGLKVALVEALPVLGGANSSAVRVHLGGRLNLGPYPRLGDVVAEIAPRSGGNAAPAENYMDDRKASVVAAERNIRVFTDMRVTAVEKDGSAIAAVIGTANRDGERVRFSAPLFADCTGDGAVGFMAGADWRMGRESRAETGEAMAPLEADSMTMGASVQWYAKKTGSALFPSEPWMIPFNDGNCEHCVRGDWDWETGMFRDQIKEAERIRDYGMLVVYSNWSFLKNGSSRRAKYADLALEWVAYVAGKRESRRLLGDVILTQHDVFDNREYPDGTCCTTWPVDLHYPMPKSTRNYTGEPFRSICTHKTHHAYPIPYRCLYSRNVSNLFMAGRNISVTHVALGTVRVMRTTGMMGEVVGMAAEVCRRFGCGPRGVYESHFGELKSHMLKGVGRTGNVYPQNYTLGRMLGGEPLRATESTAVRDGLAKRILCIGDSITVGDGSVTSYRQPFDRLLKEKGARYEFVGSQRSSDGLRHEGYCGLSSERVCERMKSLFAFGNENPDIVLIHSGHNHSAEEEPVASIVAAHRAMIEDARAINPHVAVFVAQVIESGELPKYSYIPDLNRALGILADEMDTHESRVIVVNVAEGFDWRTDTVADKVHPNDVGAEKIARKWFEAILPFL